MTTAQLDRQEKDAFLEWRRGLAEYVPCLPLTSAVLTEDLLADCKIVTSSCSHLSSAISKSGGNYGVSWSVRISLYKLWTHAILSVSDAKILRHTFRMSRELKEKLELGRESGEVCCSSIRRICSLRSRGVHPNISTSA